MLPVSTRCPARVACGLVAFALVACLFAPPARAQSTWLDHGHRASGLLEVLFPSFDGEDTGFPDWTWYATGRFPLGGETHFVGELPFTQMDLVGTTSEATIGNPYLGVEYAPRHPVEAAARSRPHADREPVVGIHAQHVAALTR